MLIRTRPLDLALRLGLGNLPSHGPNGRVADSPDEAKAAFRAVSIIYLLNQYSMSTCSSLKPDLGMALPDARSVP